MTGSPTLPPNVIIFSPAKPATIKALLNASLFTRLSLSSSAQAAQLKAISDDKRLDETFCLKHGSSILIFDSEADGKDLQDAHHEHFRAVCLLLKDHDIALNFASCVFDADTALKVGFQLDKLNEKAVLVIDLREAGGSEDDSEDDDDDGEEISFETTEEV